MLPLDVCIQAASSKLVTPTWPAAKDQPIEVWSTIHLLLQQMPKIWQRSCTPKCPFLSTDRKGVSDDDICVCADDS